MDRVKLLQEKVDLIKNIPVQVSKVTSLTELYQFIDSVNDGVKMFYPHITCKDRCFLCCQHSNIPTATALEWEYLYEFILNSSEEFKNELIDTTKKLFSTHSSELKRIHFALNSSDDQFKLNELYDTLPNFKGKSCIFLKEGSCSVYNSRPGKCRTQGYSLMQFGPNIQFQTCLPEMIKLEELLQKQGSRKVLMPIWNDYEKQIQAIAKMDKNISSVLPVWVYSHIEDNKLIPKVNLKPDFENILKNII